jgi:hypothetical protein
MNKFATIVIPFAYNRLWLQTCIASFRAFKNSLDAEIMVIDNSEGKNRSVDIKVLTETLLGEGIKIIPQGYRMPDGRLYATHASALNYAMQLIDTPYMFATESDVTIARDGWLDWYASRLRDDAVAMVGWFWPGRQYINPSQTLLDMKILWMISAEIKNNKGTLFVWGKNNEHRFRKDHCGWDWQIENGLMGPFNEVRGFSVDAERPDTHDTGSWLYFRLRQQYECARVPGEEIPIPNWRELRCAPTKYQYIGDSEDNAYLFHHSAGTVSHDYEKHLVTVEWQSYCVEWWLRREYRLWHEIVPEFIRKQTIDLGLVPPLEQEIQKALRRIHIITIGDKVRAYHGEVEKYIDGTLPEPNRPGDGLNAEVVGFDQEEGTFIIEFEENPGGDTTLRRNEMGGAYYKQRMEGGKWYANSHPKWLVKR